MKLRTYRARSMAEALTQVKSDLGTDAVILHTRMFKSGGVLGLFAHDTVEITASDQINVAATPRLRSRVDASAAAARSRPATTDRTITADAAERAALRAALAQREATRAQAPVGYAPAPFTAAHAERAKYAVPAPMMPARPASLAPAPEPAIEMPVHNRRSTLTLDADQASAVREAARLATHPAEGAAALHAELAVIRRMVGQVLQTSPASLTAAPALEAAPVLAPSALKTSGALAAHYTRLIENDVAQEVADEVVAGVRDELSQRELADAAAVRAAVLRRLVALLPSCDESESPASNPPADGRPLTVALIGPTGVGKTTTLAKLAAGYRLRDGKRVTLITTDTYRVAAVDQLRTYANIIGVELKIAHTPAELAAALAAASSSDVILIDTAGRSPADAARLTELRALLDAARPHQTHLVLSSVSNEGALIRAAERFRPLNPNLLVFTKLDEAANLGVLVNVARRMSTRLSYITTGQEVPTDIAPARRTHLARTILDGIPITPAA
ncbi:hypothetical protein BH11PLA1_BH11PLA1_09900 [soil metagenome]